MGLVTLLSSLLFFSSALQASPSLNFSPATSIVQIASGGMHHCARFSDGKLRCWGINADGQLGLGKDDLWLVNPTKEKDVLLPLPATDIALGDRHTCAILSDRTVRCWGQSLYGQMGANVGPAGETPDSMGENTPIVPLPNDFVPVKLAASKEGACAISYVGKVYCWGDGTGEESLAPWHVELAAPAKSISRADTAWVALLETGHLQTFTAKPYNGEVQTFEGWPSEKLLSLQSGMFAICGKFSDGTVHCQGRPEMAPHANAIDFGIGLSAQKFACANNGHHCCAILAPSGTLKCWGNNATGQLGDSERKPLGQIPENSGDYLPFVDLGKLARVREVSLGFGSTCALIGPRSVHCWGYGHTGPRACNIDESTPFHF